MKKIYLDYAATTPVKMEVVLEMMPYFAEQNDNDLALEEAKRRFEKLIYAPIGTVSFNSGGSYGNNEIIKSFAHNNRHKGMHIITSQIEHPSVYKVIEHLVSEGFEASYVKVDHQGILDLNHFESLLRSDTILVSIMLINNELGTRQPIEKISELCKKTDTLLHVDAVQALGNERINVNILGCDAMSFSAHKVYAPKGCGAVYVKSGLTLEPLVSKCELNGFDQATNMPYIMGFVKALEIAYNSLEDNIKKKRALREKLIVGLENLEFSIKYNGPRENNSHHPGISNFYYPLMDGDSLVINYDFNGIALSSGSACSSGALSASHVLTAIGLTETQAKKCIRITVGDFTTQRDIAAVIEATSRILKGMKNVR